MSKKTERRNAQTDWRRMGIGCGVSMLGTAVLTAAGAWLVHRELAGEMWMNYLAAGILLLSSFLGGMTVRDGGLGSVVGAAVLYWMALLGTALFLFREFPAGIWATVLPVLGGSGSALLLGWNRSGKRRSRRRRRHR